MMTLLGLIDKSLATTSTSEAGPSSVAGEEPMDTDEVISKSSAKSPSSPVKRKLQPVMSPRYHLHQSLPGSPVKKHQTLVTVQWKERKK